MPTTAAVDQEKSELHSVLSSGILDRAPTLVQLLTYICSKYFEGATQQIKEYNIAVEALGRPAGFDQKRDSIVRVEAHKLRRRLREYYETEGADHPVHIEIPPGQYAPKFVFQPARRTDSYIPEHRIPADRLPTEEATLAPQPALRRGWRKLAWLGAGAVGVLSVSVMIALSFYRQTNLDLFWARVTQQPGPVLICIGQPKTYNFDTRTQAALDAWFTDHSGGQTASAATPLVPFEDIVPTWDRNISIADAQAFLRISNLFAQKGRKAQLRGGRSVALADLRGKPCVLIGAFNNDWTLALAGELRFYFDHVAQTSTSMVRDRWDTRNNAWTVANSWPYPRMPTDYAIVTRVRNATTEQTVVIAAGITQFGTVAAGEFLTNSAYFDAALKTAPRDWYRKNMQVVLSVKVMAGTAGPPNVLAVHFW
jgi:hypothetical protein